MQRCLSRIQVSVSTRDPIITPVEITARFSAQEMIMRILQGIYLLTAHFPEPPLLQGQMKGMADSLQAVKR